jgi:hypothetical protein
MHDIPVFSKKIIDLIGIGNSLSVDNWLVEICKFYLENNLNEYIITLPEFTSRIFCLYDSSYERDIIQREQLFQYLNSKEYKSELNDMKKILKKYFNK